MRETIGRLAAEHAALQVELARLRRQRDRALRLSAQLSSAVGREAARADRAERALRREMETVVAYCSARKTAGVV